MVYDLHPKLKRFFEPSPPDEVAFGYLGRDLARVFFEVLRNIVVIGGIKFFSDKTGSALLHTIFDISLGMLVLFFYSFITQWDLRIFRHISDSLIAGVVDFFLTFVLSIACTYVCYIMIAVVVSEIANVQGR
jgi:hypothetical protein